LVALLTHIDPKWDNCCGAVKFCADSFTQPQKVFCGFVAFLMFTPKVILKMKTLFKGIVIGMAALAFTGITIAAEKGTAEEAMAMVKKGVAFIKANGKEKAFAEFNNPKGAFIDRDLYVMCYDMAGNNKCHGSNPKLIGKNLLEIKDADGKFIVKSFIETANGGKGWVDYKWPNAITKAIEPKSTYVEKVDDVLIGVGIYK
jgi:hypothetical protein